MWISEKDWTPEDVEFYSRNAIEIDGATFHVEQKEQL